MPTFNWRKPNWIEKSDWTDSVHTKQALPQVGCQVVCCYQITDRIPIAYHCLLWKKACSWSLWIWPFLWCGVWSSYPSRIIEQGLPLICAQFKHQPNRSRPSVFQGHPSLQELFAPTERVFQQSSRQHSQRRKSVFTLRKDCFLALLEREENTEKPLPSP